jgi:hypothetical protein
MSDAKDLESIKDKLEEMPADQVREPNMPVHFAVSEALALRETALTDKPELSKRKLDFDLVDLLGPGGRALRQADTNYMIVCFGSSELAEQFRTTVEESTDLRENCTHQMVYAFDGNATLMKAVDDIKQGSSYSDLVQDLSDLSGLAAANAPLLKAVGTDMKMFEQADELSTTLGELLAKTTAEKLERSPEKDTRDRAFTLIDNAVDKIRKCGKSVFWKDSRHAALYASAYLRKISRRAEKQKQKAAVTAA